MSDNSKVIEGEIKKRVEGVTERRKQVIQELIKAAQEIATQVQKNRQTQPAKTAESSSAEKVTMETPEDFINFMNFMKSYHERWGEGAGKAKDTEAINLKGYQILSYFNPDIYTTALQEAKKDNWEGNPDKEKKFIQEEVKKVFEKIGFRITSPPWARKQRSDLDGEAARYFFEQAGIQIDSKDLYIDGGGKAPGKALLDGGDKEGIFVGEVEGEKSIIFDHHTPDAGRDTAAANFVFKFLDELGFYDNLKERDREKFKAMQWMAKFVVSVDNKTYLMNSNHPNHSSDTFAKAKSKTDPKEFFKGSSEHIIGLERFILPADLIEFIKLRLESKKGKDLSEDTDITPLLLERLNDHEKNILKIREVLQEGDPELTKALKQNNLTIEQLKSEDKSKKDKIRQLSKKKDIIYHETQKQFIRDKSLIQAGNVEDSLVALREMQKDGLIIDSGSHKIAVDIGYERKGDSYTKRLKTGSDGAAYSGCDVYINFLPDQKGFFISAPATSLPEGFSLKQGIVVRNSMCLKPQEDNTPRTVTLTEILTQFGFDPKNATRELKVFLASEVTQQVGAPETPTTPEATSTPETTTPETQIDTLNQQITALIEQITEDLLTKAGSENAEDMKKGFTNRLAIIINLTESDECKVELGHLYDDIERQIRIWNDKGVLKAALKAAESREQTVKERFNKSEAALNAARTDFHEKYKDVIKRRKLRESIGLETNLEAEKETKETYAAYKTAKIAHVRLLYEQKYNKIKKEIFHVPGHNIDSEGQELIMLDIDQKKKFKDELSQFKGEEIFSNFQLAEHKKLLEVRKQALAEKPKALLGKTFAWYLGQTKFKKLILSTLIGTGVAIGLGVVGGVAGALGYGTIRFGKLAAISTFSGSIIGTASGYLEALTDERADQRKAAFKNEFNRENIEQMETNWKNMADIIQGRRNLSIAVTAAAGIVAGYSLGAAIGGFIDSPPQAEPEPETPKTPSPLAKFGPAFDKFRNLPIYEQEKIASGFEMMDHYARKGTSLSREAFEATYLKYLKEEGSELTAARVQFEGHRTLAELIQGVSDKVRAEMMELIRADSGILTYAPQTVHAPTPLRLFPNMPFFPGTSPFKDFLGDLKDEQAVKIIDYEIRRMMESHPNFSRDYIELMTSKKLESPELRMIPSLARAQLAFTLFVDDVQKADSAYLRTLKYIQNALAHGINPQTESHLSAPDPATQAPTYGRAPSDAPGQPPAATRGLQPHPSSPETSKATPQEAPSTTPPPVEQIQGVITLPFEQANFIRDAEYITPKPGQGLSHVAKALVADTVARKQAWENSYILRGNQMMKISDFTNGKTMDYIGLVYTDTKLHYIPAREGSQAVFVIVEGENQVGGNRDLYNKYQELNKPAPDWLTRSLKLSSETPTPSTTEAPVTYNTKTELDELYNLSLAATISPTDRLTPAQLTNATLSNQELVDGRNKLTRAGELALFWSGHQSLSPDQIKTLNAQISQTHSEATAQIKALEKFPEIATNFDNAVLLLGIQKTSPVPTFTLDQITQYIDLFASVESPEVRNALIVIISGTSDPDLLKQVLGDNATAKMSANGRDIIIEYTKETNNHDTYVSSKIIINTANGNFETQTARSGFFGWRSFSHSPQFSSPRMKLEAVLDRYK